MSPSAITPEGGSETGVSLREVGEFALIDRVTTDRVQPATTELGPGDDSAVVTAADGRVVACTDVLVEVCTSGSTGRAPSRSDARPRPRTCRHRRDGGGAHVAAGGTGVPLVDARGAARAAGRRAVGRARSTGAGLVGGDLTSAPVIVVSVTALGDLQGRSPVLRSGARPGDRVAVCGRLGWSAAGLAVLGRGFRSPAALVDAHRVPEPPYSAGPQAADAGATSMIDVSGRPAGRPRARRARLEGDAAAAVPGVHGAPRLAEIASALGLDPLRWVLTGGEDHALAATFPGDAPLPEG